MPAAVPNAQHRAVAALSARLDQAISANPSDAERLARIKGKLATASPADLQKIGAFVKTLPAPSNGQVPMPVSPQPKYADQQPAAELQAASEPTVLWKEPMDSVIVEKTKQWLKDAAERAPQLSKSLDYLRGRVGSGTFTHEQLLEVIDYVQKHFPQNRPLDHQLFFAKKYEIPVYAREVTTVKIYDPRNPQANPSWATKEAVAQQRNANQQLVHQGKVILSAEPATELQQLIAAVK